MPRSKSVKSALGKLEGGGAKNAILQDEAVRSRRELKRATLTQMPLHEIQGRPQGDTRSPRPAHVKELAASIEEAGALLHPVVVDCHGRLIAGLHRLEALRLLHRMGKWGTTAPVRMIADLDAAKEPIRALQLELVENDIRQNYAFGNIAGLYEKCMKMDQFHHGRGRTPAGKIAVGPFLEANLSCSRRHVRRVTRALKESKGIIGKSKPEPRRPKLSVVYRDLTLLRNALGSSDVVLERRVKKKLDELLPLVQELLRSRDAKKTLSK